ncbi:MAG TPA: EscU/YscU/HrcU family type III secretion system export apparatus switch protein [Luteimonas sp.]|nr:EscU/YscU/HrcU family type III secretion system export apparatus switch protein [Luteimonas sp.]
MASEDQDKTEQPTSYRLEEARKKGEVSKSPDVTGTAVLIAFAVTTVMTGAWVMQALAQATRDTLSLAGGRPTLGPGLVTWLRATYFPVWQSLTPLALALIVIAIIANVLQTGPVFSSHPITPDFKRLNPVQTFKRLFSMRTLWELGKMVLKMLLLAALGYFLFGQMRALVESVAATEPQRLPALALKGFGKASLYVLLILAVMAVLDFLMTRRQYMRKMRTSRRELRDEVKRRDGDPEVKSKQKRLLREILKKARSVQNAAEADIILTNPTHVAVALQYRPATMRAPIVLTKGSGYLSRRIREVASRRGVPILRSPALARALYRECEIDAPVPEKLYARLAPVYRWLFNQKRSAVSA